MDDEPGQPDPRSGDVAGAAEGTIELKDLRIAVARAQLRGWLYEDASGEPNWSIDVVGAGHRFGDGESARTLQPHFYDESMPLRVGDWRELEHRSYRFAWQDDESDDSLPTLYLCSHLSLPLSELSLGARDGRRFALLWQGLAEANWDEDYGRDLPFRIELPIAFAGQEVRFWHDGDEADIEAAARAILRRRGLSDASLRYREHRRFRDDPDDEHYRLVRALFDPAD